MSRKGKKIDLEKRNRLIAKYVPSLMEPYDEDAPEEEINFDWSIEELVARWPKGVEVDIGPMFSDPERFAAMSVDEAVAAMVAARAGPPPPRMTVSVDEFFDGNNDPQSIAPNLDATTRHPGLAGIRGMLQDIRSRPEVVDVRIAIHEWPNPQMPEDDGLWPAAEFVYVWTTAPKSDVERWVKPLRSDEVAECAITEASIDPEVTLPPGVRLYRVSWD
jgi:hypothetical protein